jgi:hypothetical protein
VAPNSPMFTIATVSGSRPVPNRVTRGGSAATSISPVAVPWMVRPTMNSGADGAVAASTEPTTNAVS